ncbi:sensor histidine kinase [Actinocorallia longicatena]|uniref:histidine kinase n=1 Tax=Actinocorallia longicatena TaxID=111803 RepID=A0ABP6QCC0_9ACTN
MRLSVRTRLTLIYGGLVLAMAAALVTVTYLQSVRTINNSFGKVQVMLPSDGLRPGPDVPFPASGGDERPAPNRIQSYVDNAVARDVAGRKQDALSALVQSSLIIFLIFAVVALLVSHLVARRMLRPLAKITATAQRLSHSSLHERIALEGPSDEIKDLADTFDAMLDRLHLAFDSQRRFVANASHELRTPLTINRTVLEVALARRSTPEETKILAGTLLETTSRHERLIEGLLLLARSENEPQERVPVDLSELAASSLDDLAVPDGVLVERRLSPAATAGEPVLLERCVANLLENAARYNLPDGRIWISTWQEHGWSVVRVENTGATVPSHALDTIYEPFRRLRPDRTGSKKGAGLGLSIVRSVVRAHGGTLETHARPEGGGLLTILRFPAASPPAAQPSGNASAAPV